MLAKLKKEEENIRRKWRGQGTQEVCIVHSMRAIRIMAAAECAAFVCRLIPPSKASSMERPWYA
jgi:hypothetical protein